jgi:4-hydroxy-tetrahydrodipicolinate synthase
MKKLKGMIAAQPTPFKADESIDFEGVSTLLEHLIKAKMSAVLIGGSTGEYSLMSVDERKALISHACKVAGGRIDLIAGASTSRPDSTKDLIKHAKEAGADFALVIPPYYLQTSEQGIIDYYKEVAEDAGIGIVIYHYPAATCVTLSPELILELSKIENVVSIKDTDDMEHTSKLINLFKDNDDFTVINGSEHIIMGVLSAGGDGTMGIVHNLVPEMMMEIYNSFQANDVVRAREINYKLLSIYSLMEEEPYPGPVKAALEMLGLPGGIPRRPIVPPSEGMKAKLREELKKLGLL